MIQLITILAFLLFTSPALAISPGVIGSSAVAPPSVNECEGYLVCQNFETTTTGYDNGETWNETADGTVEAAYTTTALRGSQSLYINDSTGTNQTWHQFGTTNPVYAFFRYRPTSTASNAIIFVFQNQAGNEISGHLVLRGDNYLRAFHGAAIYSVSATTLDDNKTYFIWVKYQASTGTDGIIQVWAAESTELDPTPSKPESTFCSVTNGDSPNQAGRVYLQNTGEGAGIFDQVLVSSSVIGDVPE